MTGAFRFDPIALPAECISLRDEVRGFLAAEKAAGLCQVSSDFGGHFSAEFSRRLGAKGWIGMTWPRRYGGGERSTLERYVVTEELLVAGAPVTAHWTADRQSGPLLLRFGTEAQRQRFLPGICRGETYFCIGMSEPDSGSDLASIRSRAVPVEGGWELTGAKIWTDRSQIAGDRDKADPQPRRHRGFQRGRLRPRLHPVRHADRRGRRRLEAGDQRARL